MPCNILSVDIDFLVRDLHLIQGKGDHDLPAEYHWQVVRWKTNAPFDLDDDALAWLDNLVATKCKTARRYFVEEHDEIMPILYREKVDTVNLVNVDYHHDVDYGEEDKRLAISNWVLHAINEKLITNYAWVTQPGAEMCKTVAFANAFSTTVWNTVDVEKLPDFDVLVVCLSKHFTPPDYWDLIHRYEKED